MSAHSLVEIYSVLTRLPLPKRLSAADALTTIEANWRDTATIHLTGSEMWATIRQAERLGIVGGRMYDALIARAAVKAGASTLLTWNVRDFSAFAQEIRIETPNG